ncbi:MAG: cysteine desulfurase / selenocysteine lyase [Puniceicoccaceae bacterium 5H]|nr:MAG: cysteine desulfurase / selenocysteine lyase [Puniceicoccaceae bacterium 5H]
MGIETASQQVQQWRGAFPLLNQLVNGQPLVYLDNAATTQKPQVVIDRLQRYYAHDNANIHRGVHALSQRATEDYEAAREVVARFLGGVESRQCVFVRGATEAVNLVAQCYLRPKLGEGDVILLTGMEHHANIVPWQLVAEERGARIEVLPVTPEGELDLEALPRMLRDLPVKLMAFVHTSNSLGTINPSAEIIALCREAGVPVLLDAAQAAPHQRLDVPALDPDFLVFSGHKTYGPTGIGVLYAKWQHLSQMPPYQGGGDMILKVSFEQTRFKEPPERFEAGTPHIAGAIGLATALEYFMELDQEALLAHEAAMRQRAEAGLGEIEGLRIIGQAPRKASVVSFVVDDVHPHDIGTFLDQDGIAIRAGHHCTQPLMKHLGLPGTARASFAFYNTMEEVDALVRGVQRIVKFFR